MLTESLLRAARVTKYLPWLRGVGLLCRLYSVLPLPAGWTGRVADFDGTLLLDVDPREIIGVNIWHRPNLFEQQERALFVGALRPGCVVLDVGANIGIYSLLAAKRGATVFAVEADPRNVARLKAHVALNGFQDRITVVSMAATDRDCRLHLYRDRLNCGHSNLFAGEDAVVVPGRTIDSLQLPPIDVCKIDIEGAEPMALAGMRETLHRSPKLKILIEYCQAFGHADELLRLLRAHFAAIQVVGGGPVRANSSLPTFCNLWCSAR